MKTVLLTWRNQCFKDLAFNKVSLYIKKVIYINCLSQGIIYFILIRETSKSHFPILLYEISE